MRSVLSFLTHLQLRGKAYSTINVHRSMLSTTLEPYEGVDIGSHPLVVRLMKGCFNRRPPEPRYSSTWNPDQVLLHASASSSNDTLELSVLSAKVCTLLALATLLRVAEITSIALHMVFSETGVNITLTKLRKAQRSGALQTLFIPAMQDEHKCPVHCLRTYISRTENLRSERNSGRLLISHRKPHSNVSRATVGRWIKDYLKASGIDINVFSAHSVRGASASQAARKGVPVDTILSTANWSAASTFNRFYRRDLPTEGVASTVFQ